MRITPTVALLCLVAHAAHSQAACRPEGTWQLVSGKADGQPYPATSRSIKIITKSHFAVFSEEARGVKELKTAADSLQAFRTFFAAGGTYRVQGTTYTETIEYTADPAYSGISLPFACRIEGDRFFQTGAFPMLANGKKVREIKLEEVWRRIE